MIVTHSAIETSGYPDTTRSADGLLEGLGLKRRPASPDTASPPPLDLDVAVKAFPPDERNWLRVTSATEEGPRADVGHGAAAADRAVEDERRVGLKR
jgi:hypothetical protein